MMWDTIAAIYLFGLVIMLFHSIYLYIDMLNWKSSGVINILDKHGMKTWLVSRVIFWPYFLFCKTNPIVLMSCVFFGRYGDEGHIYYNSRGLKNFLNDCFRGVNRYKNYRVISSSVELDQNTVPNELKELNLKPKYASIIIAKYNKNFLFKALYTLSDDDDISTSRFELDQCQCLTREGLINELNKLNSDVTDRLMTRLEELKS